LINMPFGRKFPLLFVLWYSCFFIAEGQEHSGVDICVYGGTSAGVMAAYTAKKMGKSVLLIEPGRHLGGLSSGGLGYTDIGNKYAISGLALDFYRRIGQHYGKFEQWIFEPHVAENLFKDYIKRANVKVLYSYRLKSVSKDASAIKSIIIEKSDKPDKHSNLVINAKIFIDCSYEGDLMAKAGVSYTVGREANSKYNETYNGVQLRDKHQFLDGIDPYVIKGKPETGWLWGISNKPMDPAGSGDKKVQSYNFRICLSSDPKNQIPIDRPEDYDSSRYELLLRVLEKEPQRPFNLILKPDLMPNYKTDINNNGPFSTDMIGMNYEYAEADYDKRKEILKAHELYTKGLLYFIGHESRMPMHLRQEMLRWAYPKDEYPDNNHWSPQMYIREARRMVGPYVMTQANCEGREVVPDAIGLAAYTMDSHNCQRIVIEKDGMKMVKNEGDVQIGGFPPYPISYRSLTPKENECKNLLVPVCISASHIAYGSIRMEPVFMVMAQSAAVAASLAIDGRTPVQKIDVRKLQSIIKSNPLADGSQPDVLIDNDNIKSIEALGAWSKIGDARFSYAPSRLQYNGPASNEAYVRFVSSQVKGKYKVYSYFPKIDSASSSTTFIVSDGKALNEISINHSDINIQGQTSGEWILVGEFDFVPGKTHYVEITNKNADGIVIADAVLFVSKRN
jgi:hypothetical protein